MPSLVSHARITKIKIWLRMQKGIFFCNFLPFWCGPCGIWQHQWRTLDEWQCQDQTVLTSHFQVWKIGVKSYRKSRQKQTQDKSARCFHLSKEPWVVLTLDYPTTTANWAALYEFEEKPTLDVRRQPVLREVVSLEKKSETWETALSELNQPCTKWNCPHEFDFLKPLARNKNWRSVQETGARLIFQLQPVKAKSGPWI